MLWATFLGIVIGALPGLTATMGVALLTTLTFTMPHTEAIMVLICIYVGAIYGGSRSAILLNIPGTPASAASTLDGYPLARQGLAGRAMGISTVGLLARHAVRHRCALPLLHAGPERDGAHVPELRVLLDLASSASSSPARWPAAIRSRATSPASSGCGSPPSARSPTTTISASPSASTDLAGGIGLLPALVGAFGVAEVLQAMRGPAVKAVSINHRFRRSRASSDVLKHWRTILRSGAIGTFIGILPGLGEDTAAWSSYAAARRASKEKEKYGKGSIEGLMAAETGESACVPGAIIPVLTLARAGLGAGRRADGGHDDPRPQSRPQPDAARRRSSSTRSSPCW